MSAPSGMFVTTGSFRTHYIEDGTGDPVILLHGGGAGADSVSNWRDCLPLFAKRRRAIAVDMVGFGRSRATARSSPSSRRWGWSGSASWATRWAARPRSEWP
jgi:pimeloyl-ACP methyl ester carboxylesterase